MIKTDFEGYLASLSSNAINPFFHRGVMRALNDTFHEHFPYSNCNNIDAGDYYIVDGLPFRHRYPRLPLLYLANQEVTCHVPLDIDYEALAEKMKGLGFSFSIEAFVGKRHPGLLTKESNVLDLSLVNPNAEDLVRELVKSNSRSMMRKYLKNYEGYSLVSNNLPMDSFAKDNLFKRFRLSDTDNALSLYVYAHACQAYGMAKGYSLLNPEGVEVARAYFIEYPDRLVYQGMVQNLDLKVNGVGAYLLYLVACQLLRDGYRKIIDWTVFNSVGGEEDEMIFMYKSRMAIHQDHVSWFYYLHDLTEPYPVKPPFFCELGTLM